MAASTVSFLIQDDRSPAYVALDEAVRSMVSCRVVQGRFRVELPVILASGGAATVAVWPEGGGETFLVSDDGGALFEVMAGAYSETVFRRVAKERCDRYGANFDGGSMLYLRVSEGRLRGAIVAMANLMKEVVDETVLRSIEQTAQPIDLELWDKLDRAFEGFRVERKAHLAGESTAKHEFSAIVQMERSLIAFDTFTRQGNSINSVYVKMSDIARVDTPPKGIAVTTRRSEVGPKLHLITSVAQVIEISIEKDELLKLARAA
jgi:hypothetical protein